MELTHCKEEWNEHIYFILQCKGVGRDAVDNGITFGLQWHIHFPEHGNGGVGDHSVLEAGPLDARKELW